MIIQILFLPSWDPPPTQPFWLSLPDGAQELIDDHHADDQRRKGLGPSGSKAVLHLGRLRQATAGSR